MAAPHASQDPETVPFTRAAEIVPSSIDEDARTVEVIWTTGARVRRYTWEGPFIEELALSRSAIDLKRLNAGAPLLNAHLGGHDVSRVLGVVVPGSARLEGDKGIAKVRFDEADDELAERAFRKVQRGIVRGISVG